MLTTLLLALAALAAGEPESAPPPWRTFDADAFCSDLKTAIAAASERPEAFASLPKRTFGGSGIEYLSAQPHLGHCYVNYVNRVPTLMCSRTAWGPVASSVEEAAQAAGRCTGVPVEPREPKDYRDDGLLLSGPSWTLEVEPQGCDRCRGMPSVGFQLSARRALP